MSRQLGAFFFPTSAFVKSCRTAWYICHDNLPESAQTLDSVQSSNEISYHTVAFNWIKLAFRTWIFAAASKIFLCGLGLIFYIKLVMKGDISLELNTLELIAFSLLDLDYLNWKKRFPCYCLTQRRWNVS